MAYKEKIQFREEGTERVIDQACYATLSSEDWAAWIDDRLNGRDSLVPYPREDFPHTAFTYVAREVSPSVTAAVHSGIRSCLQEAYTFLERRGRGTAETRTWSNDGIDELLILVGSVGSDVNHDPVDDPHPFYHDAPTIQRFLEVLKPRPELLYNPDAGEEHDLYHRVLSTLVAVQARLPYSFWEGQLHHADKYTGVCMEGAEMNSVDDALQLLHHVPWESDQAQEQMAEYFDLFFYEHKLDASLVSRVHSEKTTLPPTAGRIIDEAYALVT
ncbi:hypothetical protein HYW21_00880 [Candidatus Woesearchaeota archaeon]|nr:hypothetical protein [Candidatus Woesearchaeota archaeon]